MSTGSNSKEWPQGTPGSTSTRTSTPGRQLMVLEALDRAKVQYYHLTAVLIAGLGFFTDAYDLFVVSVVAKLLGRIYYQQDETKVGTLPIAVNLFVVGSALFGTLAGQFLFGWLGDKLGRKRAYGTTLTIMLIFSIASGLSVGKSPKAVMVSLCFFRFWLGVGIGGDYPLSATIISEYANTQTRGAFIGAVFAMQGFGILTAGLLGLVLSAIFDTRYPTENFKTAQPLGQLSTAPEADYLWRTLFMLGAVPAAFTFYYRMRMPETARYTALVRGDTKKATLDMMKVLKVPAFELSETDISLTIYEESALGGSAPEFYKLFSRKFVEKHGLELLGTATSWFLLDITYYSGNLFQNRIFSFIRWIPDAEQMNGLEEVYKVSRAQLIVAMCATLPGYWVCVLLVDHIGRRIIQLQGFIFMGVFMLAAAVSWNRLQETRGGIQIFLALYSLTFFFANFGPNTTTFIIPAELFPARLRATCHGISAGAGKAGSIVGVFGFLYASQDKQASRSYPYPPGIGFQNTFYIFAAVNFVGAAVTALLIPETKKMPLEYLSKESTIFAAGDNESNGLSVHPNIEAARRNSQAASIDIL